MTCVFSPDRRYRYSLWRDTGELLGSGRVNWIMLNPSTADEDKNDPTVRRCIGFTRSLGYRELVVTNLFALRSTDPFEMMLAADPVGPENDVVIENEAKIANLVVCAWGNHGAHGGRAEHVLRIIARTGMTPHCLRMTGARQPEHPLYTPGSLRPTPLT